MKPVGKPDALPECRSEPAVGQSVIWVFANGQFCCFDNFLILVREILVIAHPGMDIGWVSSAARMARSTAVWLAFAVLTTERNAA